MWSRVAKPKVLVIAGPTGSGKTDLSLALARALRGEIISADSAQVFRHLNIGTDKVSARDQGGIPHALIDVHDFTSEASSAFTFAQAATAAIDVRTLILCQAQASIRN